MSITEVNLHDFGLARAAPVKLEPFRLERYFAQHEFATEHLLGCSDAESWTVEELLDLQPGGREAFLHLRLGYTESNGSPELRQAIARLHRTGNPEQVLVCAGAQEAIFLFMTTWLQPGDRVVVLTPCYQSLLELPRGLGCEVVSWKLQPPWKPDLEQLARLLPGARLLVVNFPHNPTGAHLTHEEQAALVGLCRHHGVWLFSDEVYRGLEHSPEDLLASACTLYERAVSLGVTSKSFGLAGLRIGWLILHDRQVYQALATRKDYTSLCCSGPSEFLATVALNHRDTLVERNRRILLENLALELPNPLGWIPPQAGPVAFPSVEVSDVDCWCQDLSRQGVLLVPGSLFGWPGHVRLGLGRAGYARGLRALREILQRTGSV